MSKRRPRLAPGAKGEGGRNDIERIGLFSELGYISTGEKYNDNAGISLIPERGKGKQLLTNPPKRGHDLPSVYIGKTFGRAFEGEGYTDYVAMRRRDRLVKRALNIVQEPFKPSSVPQKPSGSGSVYGTIEHAWPLYPDEERRLSPQTRQEEKSRASLRNFITKPGKKGSGYGYHNVTIGEPPEYVSSPYDAAHQLELEEKELHRKRIVNEKPFISAGGEIEYFDANVFKAGKPRTPRTPASQSGAAKLPILVPFRPSNPPKSGLGGTINKYPSHEPDPVPSKAQQQKAAEEARRRAAWAKIRVFRPAGGAKAYVTRSIAMENVERQMPPPYVKEVLVAARRKEYMMEELPVRRCNVLNLSS